jgi:hypothetical protein
VDVAEQDALADEGVRGLQVTRYEKASVIIVK